MPDKDGRVLRAAVGGAVTVVMMSATSLEYTEWAYPDHERGEAARAARRRLRHPRYDVGTVAAKTLSGTIAPSAL